MDLLSYGILKGISKMMKMKWKKENKGKKLPASASRNDKQ